MMSATYFGKFNKRRVCGGGTQACTCMRTCGEKERERYIESRDSRMLAAGKSFRFFCVFNAFF